MITFAWMLGIFALLFVVSIAASVAFGVNDDEDKTVFFMVLAVISHLGLSVSLGGFLVTAIMRIVMK